jgi:hypothetical protein
MKKIIAAAGLVFCFLNSTKAFTQADCEDPNYKLSDNNPGRGEIITCLRETEAWVRNSLKEVKAIFEKLVDNPFGTFTGKDSLAQVVLSTYLNLNPGDYKLWVKVLVDDMQKLLDNNVTNFVLPGDANHSCSGKSTDALAWVNANDPENLFICNGFYELKLNGRRQIVLHEYFHFVGYDDMYTVPGATRKSILAKFKDAGFVAYAIHVIALGESMETTSAYTDPNMVNLPAK